MKDCVLSNALDAKTDASFYVTQAVTSPIYQVAQVTPLDPMARLSQRLGHRVLLKREDKQPNFSFKIRGAFHHMARLPREVLQKGVLACSAGNHAQGVALAALKLNTRATIVMPRTAPEIKVSSIRNLGASIVFAGDSFAEAYRLAQKLSCDKELHLVPPYDDPYIIAGNATAGLEIIQHSGGVPDALFIPVGGGGILAGVAVLLKTFYPQTLIFGVEAEDSASMHAAREAGEPVSLGQVGLFADGVAVAKAGRESYRLVQQYVDDLITVSNDEICAAIKDVYTDTRTILETSGAIGVAGLKIWAAAHSDQRDKRLIAFATGANMDFNTLRHVAERAEIGEKTETVMAVRIPERPGSFISLCQTIGSEQSISEFNYRYCNPSQADIFLGVRMRSADDLQPLLKRLAEADFPARDFGDNEVAKLHLRHMVGGRLPAHMNELLFRFEFPERPGALLHFLSVMQPHGWNITLFHYRNHGADYSRILVGVELSEAQRDDFHVFAKKLNYPYTEETHNEAYRYFLR